MRTLPIPIRQPLLDAFCARWNVRELAVFGSVLRADFGPDSDVDVLITLDPGEHLSLESYLEMKDELSALLGGRTVDLVQERLLKNPYRRHEILRTREILYAA
jgi:predicted nucleotidyltransferase